MPLMPINSRDQAIYEFALKRLEEERDRITGSIIEIQRQLGHTLKADSPTSPATSTARKRKKRVMSAEGRARIVAALKLRWAKVKAAKAAPTAKKSSPAKPAKKKA